MDQLLPDQLKALWQCVERKELLTEEFNLMQERGLAEYRKIWSDALLLEGYRIRQISSYGRRFVFIQHDGRKIIAAFDASTLIMKSTVERCALSRKNIFVPKAS